MSIESDELFYLADDMQRAAESQSEAEAEEAADRELREVKQPRRCISSHAAVIDSTMFVATAGAAKSNESFKRAIQLSLQIWFAFDIARKRVRLGGWSIQQDDDGVAALDIGGECIIE